MRKEGANNEKGVQKPKVRKTPFDHFLDLVKKDPLWLRGKTPLLQVSQSAPCLLPTQ